MKVAQRSMRSTGDEGSVSVEFAVAAAPLLLLLAAAMLAAGRIVLADGAVTDVAATAARSASIARTAVEARRDATATAQRVLAEQRLDCQRTTVTVDTSGFTVPVGQPASVRVHVACVVALNDIALPWLPGSKVLEDSFSSPLDPFRGRT